MMAKPEITAERLRDLLLYDSETGNWTWRIDRPNQVRAGERAGYQRKDGYRVINLSGRVYLLHRLAWLYTHGRWPVSMIDHINGDPSDNRLCNLREASRSQNMMNSALPPSNTSGIKGVSYDPRCCKWHSYITLNQRRKTIGYFQTKGAAAAARKEAEAAAFGAFSNEARSSSRAAYDVEALDE